MGSKVEAPDSRSDNDLPYIELLAWPSAMDEVEDELAWRHRSINGGWEEGRRE